MAGADIVVLAQELPPWQLGMAVSLVLVAAALVGRVLANSFTGKRPPIFEGIPYIGGLLKFVAVSGARPEARAPDRSPCAELAHPLSRLHRAPCS